MVQVISCTHQTTVILGMKRCIFTTDMKTANRYTLTAFLVFGLAQALFACEATPVIAGSRCDGIDNDCNGIVDDCVEDFRPPMIWCPGDVSVECPAGSFAPAADGLAGYARGKDDCGDVDITFTDVQEVTCGGISIERTWTATDACGKTATCLQLLTVTDTTPPTLECPSSVTIDLDADPTPKAGSRVGHATCIDECFEVKVTYTDEESSPCANTRIIVRSWVAADPCFNVVQAEQVITMSDNKPPILQIPDPVTLVCPEPIEPNATGYAQCSDPDAQISYTDEFTQGCGGTHVITRKWMASDSCGNIVSMPQIIHLIDLTSPLLDLSTSPIPGGLLKLNFAASDECASPSVFGMIDIEFDKIPVTNGKFVKLTHSDGPPTVLFDNGILVLTARSALLNVHASDGCNTTDMNIDLFAELEVHRENSPDEPSDID
jgi:hypothetical protein